MNCSVRRLTDKAVIHAWLDNDRLYNAYAIGDLEPELFALSAWFGAGTGGQLKSMALYFQGLQIPALFLMGEIDGLRVILNQAPLPGRVYLTCRPEHQSMAEEFYTWQQVMPMWRMVLALERFQPVNGECIRLTSEHAEQLGELFNAEGGIGFSTAQIQQGIFYGVIHGGVVAAVAGTHLVSETYNVAAVGNVLTHPGYRGRGFGTAATSAVVAEVLRRGIRDIVLNVSQENTPAIKIYDRLGFERVCPFIEGPANARWDANRLSV